MAQATNRKVNDDRAVALNLGDITDDHEIAITVDGNTFEGSVSRIDTYGDSNDVERVIQCNISFKHRIDGPDWEPWKAFLIEEPAGVYRVNLVLFNGEKSHTRNFDAPDSIDVR